MERESKEKLPVYESQFLLVFRRFLSHRLAVAGGVVVVVLLGMALFANILVPKDPLFLDTSKRFIAPFQSWANILGTDEVGRDVLSRLLYGGRVSLIVGITAMLATLATGSLIGLLAGYFGGKIDNILMRFTDTMLCFPQVFLLLILAAFIRPNLISIALIIGVSSWMKNV